jgi:hypothetical protein
MPRCPCRVAHAALPMPALPMLGLPACRAPPVMVRVLTQCCRRPARVHGLRKVSVKAVTCGDNFNIIVNPPLPLPRAHAKRATHAVVARGVGVTNLASTADLDVGRSARVRHGHVRAARHRLEWLRAVPTAAHHAPLDHARAGAANAQSGNRRQRQQSSAPALVRSVMCGLSTLRRGRCGPGGVRCVAHGRCRGGLDGLLVGLQHVRRLPRACPRCRARRAHPRRGTVGAYTAGMGSSATETRSRGACERLPEGPALRWFWAAGVVSPSPSASPSLSRPKRPRARPPSAALQRHRTIACAPMAAPLPHARSRMRAGCGGARPRHVGAVGARGPLRCRVTRRTDCRCTPFPIRALQGRDTTEIVACGERRCAPPLHSP